MIILHFVGGLLVLTGIGLFIFTQIKGAKGESTLGAWKINLSGPPSLVLILIGVFVFVFPFTSFWNDPTAPPPVTTGTTLVDGGDVVLLPETPFGFDIYYDDSCGWDVIEWFQEDADVFGWQIQVEKFDFDGEFIDMSLIDTEVDQLTYGNYPALCYWDFIDLDVNAVVGSETLRQNDNDGYLYYLWVYSYNLDGFSVEPLFIEYLDVGIE